MTDERKNEIWRQLPYDFKELVTKTYKTGVPYDAFKYDMRAPEYRLQAEGGLYMLEFLFGTHNLTAQAEEKPKEPKYRIGDLVTIIADCPEKGMFGEVRGYNANTHHDNVAAYTFAESELEPYTLDKPSQENPLDVAKSANPPKSVGLDHTQYRFELAKEIAVALINNSNRDTRYGDVLAHDAVKIANEIVKQLKETEI